jgi:hypothetical protein
MFFSSSFMSNNISDRTYAAFNTLTITGRLSFAEVATNNGSEFLSVTLLTELKNDGETIAVTFNNSNGLLAMFKKGWLQPGRTMTVTGHLDSFAQIYFDAKQGQNVMLRRPKLHLVQAQVLTGGLGPAKKSQASVDSDSVAIDDAPEISAPVAVA